MSNIYEFPDQDQRYDEASTWIAKLDNNPSATDVDALRDWMAASEENRIVLLEIAALWDRMTVLSRLADLFPQTPARTGRSPRFALALSASVLVAVVAGLWVFRPFGADIDPNALRSTVETTLATVYETAIGEQSTVNLADGTQVILNTNSLIEVTYTDLYRLLKLDRGEIHVLVAHDTVRPLSVIAGNKIVQAVGTAFSLEITSDQQIELVVTEGKVIVGVHRRPQPGSTAAPTIVPDSGAVTVTASEHLILGSSAEEVTVLSPEAIAVKLSWQRGNLIFDAESLEAAVAEIGRYTTVEFVILDEDLKKVKISGFFKAGDVDGLLAALRENFAITYQRTDDGKILLGSL